MNALMAKEDVNNAGQGSGAALPPSHNGRDAESPRADTPRADPNPAAPRPPDTRGPPPQGVFARSPRCGAHDDPVESTDAAFLANHVTVMVHELATLLDGSLRNLSLVRKEVEHARAADPASDVGRRLDTVQRSMEQMSGLIKGLMKQGSAIGVDRLERSGPEPSVAVTVEHAVDAILPIARAKGIELAHDIDPALEDAGGAASLFTVVTNAARNAVEAVAQRTADAFTAGRVAEPGRILVRARCLNEGPKRFAVIEVLDNGPGVAHLTPEDLRRSFEFGYTTKAQGSGIGLALSRFVVLRMGGTIELRNDGLVRMDGGSGARLAASVPIHDRDPLRDTEASP